MTLTVVDNAMLACALEVFCYKPGNVNRFSDFEDTTIEDFILSIYALHEYFSAINSLAIDFGTQKISYNDINLGKYIYDAVKKINDSHRGGNTHFGTIILLFPLIFVYSLNKTNYQEQLDQLIRNTTYNDTIYLYKAINLAKGPYKSINDELDVFNSKSEQIIKQKNINIYDIMKKSQHSDLIAKILSNRYNLVYDDIFSFFKKTYESNKSYEKAIIATYLYVLSNFLDSHVVKKYGQSPAEYVKKRANGVFLNYMKTFEIDYICGFDKELKNRKINPGTTADIIAATVFIHLQSKSQKQI